MACSRYTYDETSTLFLDRTLLHVPALLARIHHTRVRLSEDIAAGIVGRLTERRQPRRSAVQGGRIHAETRRVFQRKLAPCQPVAAQKGEKKESISRITATTFSRQHRNITCAVSPALFGRG